MRRALLSGAVVLLCSMALTAQVNVDVSGPENGDTVTSPLTINASADTPRKITGWWVYVDDKGVWNTGEDVHEISARVSMGRGEHSVRVRAWDSSGAYGDYYFKVDVDGESASGSLPTPPSNARVYRNLEETSDWWKCTAPCAGGRVSTNYYTDLDASPALAGLSRQFFNGGGPYSNALFVKRGLGEHNFARNFLWDFYFYVNENTASTVYALEYDLWLAEDHYEYMLGTQIHYPNGDDKPGHWDTWNQRDRNWVHNYNKAAPRFEPNTWHRMQWHMKRDKSRRSYTYVTLVLDGGTDREQVVSFNQTQPAGWRDWDDSFGVQWQLDLNKEGTDARQWVDKVQVSLW